MREVYVARYEASDDSAAAEPVCIYIQLIVYYIIHHTHRSTRTISQLLEISP